LKNEVTTEDQGFYVVPSPKGNFNRREFDEMAMDWQGNMLFL
jgi:hypothetical protein